MIIPHFSHRLQQALLGLNYSEAITRIAANQPNLVSLGHWGSQVSFDHHFIGLGGLSLSLAGHRMRSLRVTELSSSGSSISSGRGRGHDGEIGLNL